MKTVIFGKRSFLTSELKKNIKNTSIYSIEEFIRSKEINNLKKKKINIIINSFFPIFRLNNNYDLSHFYKKSIQDLIDLLNVIKNFSINSLIYSSSAAVYSYLNKKKIKDIKKKNYALSKLICENLITDFSKNKKINYVIARIFNMYGCGDNFSIISKIIKSYKTNHILNIANKGTSIRDFVHVGNVAKTYKSLQNSNFSGVIDVGIGQGYKISDIINKLGRINFKIKNFKIKEEEISIAGKFSNIYSKNSNRNYLECYLKNKLKIKKTIVFSKFLPTNENS
jgi:nucleoside-diphosphate-sugar epimerase